MSTESGLAADAPIGKIKIVSWSLRIFGAAAFLAAGVAKLAGVEMMVGIYEQIGFGQWFRYLTGIVEVAGAVGLLMPATAAFGGLLLAVTMFFAVLTHIFILGGSFVPALVLMTVTGIVAWLHRASIANMLSRFG